MYNLLLLPATSLLFTWSTAVNEFAMYLWDTANCQPTQNTCKQIAYSFYNSLWHHHPDCYAWCRLIFLPCVCFASIYASTAAKCYILNYMWTVANFIIEGRVPYGRRLCTVVLRKQNSAAAGPKWLQMSREASFVSICHAQGWKALELLLVRLCETNVSELFEIHWARLWSIGQKINGSNQGRTLVYTSLTSSAF